jgi:acyl carrier protein
MTTSTIEPATISNRIMQVLAPLLNNGLEAWEEHILLQNIPNARYDSVTVMECVVAIEQEFDITIDFIEDDIAHTFQSVATIQSLVARKTADRIALRDGR